MMEIKILAFGIAKDILSASKLRRQVAEGLTIGNLKADLTSEFEDFAKLNSLRFAVNEEYVGDSHTLEEGDEVVLIPPVSGG